MEYMLTQEFHDAVQRKIEEDRKAGLEWRRTLVNQANARRTEKGLILEAEQSKMQDQFIGDDLEYEAMVQMIRQLSDLAGVPLPDPTPHDMGLD